MVNMARQFVQQMADGDAIEEVYLVVDKQVRANRNGNIYLQLELRDRSGAISARCGTRRSRWCAPSRPASSCSSRARCNSSRALCR